MAGELAMHLRHVVRVSLSGAGCLNPHAMAPPTTMYFWMRRVGIGQSDSRLVERFLLWEGLSSPDSPNPIQRGLRRRTASEYEVTTSDIFLPEQSLAASRQTYYGA